MRLTRSLAVAIVEVVSKDKEAKRRIDSVASYLPDSWGAAGSVRNFGFALKETYFGNGNPTAEQEPLICYGITEYTSEILNQAIAKTSVGSTLSVIKKVSYINRELHDIPHQATLFELSDGSKFVFDWHATLNSANPLIYLATQDFKKDKGSITFTSFVDK